MFVIASNITTRNGEVKQAFDQGKSSGWNSSGQGAEALRNLAKQSESSGADAIEIDIQQHHDNPDAMKFAVDAVQRSTNLQLCLSSNSPVALEAGLGLCKKPAMLNYVSVDEARLKQVLPMAAKHGTSVILLVSDPTAPSDALDMLRKTAILVGAANGEGITNDRILVDPGIIHITDDLGQRHMAETLEFLRDLPQAVDPPIRSTCWLRNGSTGAPAQLRGDLEGSLLLMLAGAGLSSAFMDVTSKEDSRALRLVKIFQNELVYSHSDIER